MILLKLGSIAAVFVLCACSTLADISHENQLAEAQSKIWVPTGGEPDGDYFALEGDHTGRASLHIRVYAENETLYLWVAHIEINDLAEKPIYEVHPKYEKTRTNNTWAAGSTVEYLRFVTIGNSKGVMFGERFYKKG